MTRELLTLIRTVDPEDREACDELNARFWCFVEGLFYVGKVERTHYYEGYDCFKEDKPRKNFKCGFDAYNSGHPIVPKYTHSLDALKAVQDAELEGWFYGLVRHNSTNGAVYSASSVKCKSVSFVSKHLSTLNLAWMDALVQAITWKRSNEK